MLASIGYAAAYTGVGIALLMLGFVALDLLTPGHLGRHIYEHRSPNAAITLASAYGPPVRFGCVFQVTPPSFQSLRTRWTCGPSAVPPPGGT